MRNYTIVIYYLLYASHIKALFAVLLYLVVSSVSVYVREIMDHLYYYCCCDAVILSDMMFFSILEEVIALVSDIYLVQICVIIQLCGAFVSHDCGKA